MDNFFGLQVNTCIFRTIYRGSYITARYISNLDHHKCKVFLLDRYPIFKLQKCTKYKLSKKDTIILYYYSIFMAPQQLAQQGHGLHYSFGTAPQLRGHVFHPHVPYIFHHFPLRYQLRQTPIKSSISPLFTPSKITTKPPKNLSNP